MSKKSKSKYCNKPDRDVPGIQCGYPLPCPYHTVVIEKGNVKIPKNLNLDKDTQDKIYEIENILFENENENVKI